MTHWCDYRSFAESLQWLADQDNEKIEEFFSELSQIESDHAGIPGMSRSAVYQPSYEPSRGVGEETGFHSPS